MASLLLLLFISICGAAAISSASAPRTSVTNKNATLPRDQGGAAQAGARADPPGKRVVSLPTPACSMMSQTCARFPAPPCEPMAQRAGGSCSPAASAPAQPAVEAVAARAGHEHRQQAAYHGHVLPELRGLLPLLLFREDPEEMRGPGRGNGEERSAAARRSAADAEHQRQPADEFDKGRDQAEPFRTLRGTSRAAKPAGSMTLPIRFAEKSSRRERRNQQKE